MFSDKASNEDKAEKYLHNTSTYNQNGIFFKEAETFGSKQIIFASKSIFGICAGTEFVL